MTESDRWGSDGPVSAPMADDRIADMPQVDLGGFVFTASGLRLPVTSALHEQRYTPTWSPRAKGGD